MQMSERDERPLVAIIIRDPWGTDADVICSALSDRSIYEKVRPCVIGDHWCVLKAAQNWNQAHGLITPKETVESGIRALKGRCPVNGVYRGGMIDVCDMHITKSSTVPSLAAAAEAFRFYKEHAEAILMAGEADAVIICPDRADKLKRTLQDFYYSVIESGYRKSE